MRDKRYYLHMSVVTDENIVENLLSRRVASDGFFPMKDEVKKRFISGDKLSFYYGIDPTGKDIHLGHTTQLFLLKGLADLGHKITLLIGDFTAKVGDPTGKDKTRKPLSDEEIKENMKTYLDQVYKILPKEYFEVRYNSEWLKNMNMEKVLELASHVTVQQMIVRDMFQERLKQEKPIGVNEFLYPLMQGYDSVAMKIDGEVGGHDQIFNMLVGRDLEKKYLNKDKIVLATKLLVNESTGKKMSKSEGEIIALNDEPAEIRRKILSLDDKMIKTIFDLCTDKEQSWIDDRYKELSPQEYKELLSDTLVGIYHGEGSIKKAHTPKEFVISEMEGPASRELAAVISRFFSKSMTEAKNLVSSGAVEVNGETEKSWKRGLKREDRIKVGKGRFGIIK